MHSRSQSWRFFPYICAVIKGTGKPHVFSWIIWGTTTLVVFLVQLEDQAGIGAWPIGVSDGITIFIACLAYVKRADIAITTPDWLFFYREDGFSAALVFNRQSFMGHCGVDKR